LGSRQLSGAGPESQHLVGCAAAWNGAVRNHNAIGFGSIPEMAGLARIDNSGTAKRLSQWRTNGHTHEVVKEAIMSCPFRPLADQCFMSAWKGCACPVATECEHEKYSAGYSVRKYGSLRRLHKVDVGERESVR
jgi:hypothetical protein